MIMIEVSVLRTRQQPFLQASSDISFLGVLFSRFEVWIFRLGVLHFQVLDISFLRVSFSSFGHFYFECFIFEVWILIVFRPRSGYQSCGVNFRHNFWHFYQLPHRVRYNFEQKNCHLCKAQYLGF